METQSNEIWWSYTSNHVAEAEAFIYSINDELETIGRVPMTAYPGDPEGSPFYILKSGVKHTPTTSISTVFWLSQALSKNRH